MGVGTDFLREVDCGNLLPNWIAAAINPQTAPLPTRLNHMPRKCTRKISFKQTYKKKIIAILKYNDTLPKKKKKKTHSNVDSVTTPNDVSDLSVHVRPLALPSSLSPPHASCFLPPWSTVASAMISSWLRSG